MMLTLSRAALAAFALGVAGCAGPATQVVVPPVASELRVRPLISSLEVRDISLPRYAASDDLVREGADGVVSALPGTVWADTPERGLTLLLADALGQITGARVAVEPWPFSSPPAASVTVRVTQLLGQVDDSGAGRLAFSGSYAISPVDSSLSDRSGRFDILVPLPNATPQALAAAQSAALGDLAETLAQRIGR
jgi:uncharacterized lipoprotein YmbA